MTHNHSSVNEPSVAPPTPHPGVETAGVQTRHDNRWPDGNPAGAIELSDTELRAALMAAPVCSKYGSISTTWCDNPNVC
jgi:hypothetical protein